jgi:hypothetical protein
MTVLIFGATGSAGGSVLRVCLESPAVTSVRAIVRRAPQVSSPKLSVVEHANYADYSAIASAFAGVDACFYCLGKSVRQVSGEAEYRRITHDFALAAAKMLRAKSPGAPFHFISGEGASINSRFMWARVKGETERDLAPFDAVCWRPGLIDGMPSSSEPRLYKAMRPFGRVLLKPFRGMYVTGADIGRAMLAATAQNLRGQTIGNAAIRDLAEHGTMSAR